MPEEIVLTVPIPASPIVQVGLIVLGVILVVRFVIRIYDLLFP